MVAVEDVCSVALWECTDHTLEDSSLALGQVKPLEISKTRFLKAVNLLFKYISVNSLNFHPTDAFSTDVVLFLFPNYFFITSG